MIGSQEFACKEVGALLVFYACAETNEQENRRIETHLAACAACAAQLAQERGLHESLMEALQATEQVDTGGILLSQCRSELAEALDDLSAPPLQERWQPFGTPGAHFRANGCKYGERRSWLGVCAAFPECC